MDSRFRGNDKKKWIPAFAGMTKKMDSRFRGNDKKKKTKNFMLFMCFMVSFVFFHG